MKWGPMLLEKVDKPFNSKDYIYEIKFDGIRALIYIDKDKIKIISRKNIDITNKFIELKKIKEVVSGKVILDGEIVVMENGKPSFKGIQERLHLKNKERIKYESIKNPVIFMAFDILYNNKDLRDLSLIKRKEILNKIEDNEVLIKVKYIENAGIKLFDIVKKMGLEGIVAKKKNSKYYISKRSDEWLKIKNIKDDIFYIGGYLEKENSNVISLLLGEYKDNLLYYVGKVSIGKKQRLYKKVKGIKIEKESPFVDFKEENYVFIKPSIKCNVSYLEKTRNNHLRHPVIKY